MGMFDSVYVKCPHCSAQMEYQSKADDDAYCRSFTVETAPDCIAFDVMNSPQYCQKCGNWAALTDSRYPPGWSPPRPALVASKIKSPKLYHSHPQGMRWWDGEFIADDIIEN